MATSLSLSAQELGGSGQRNGEEMVVCRAVFVPLMQCGANALCDESGGWHLCSTSEFLAAFGGSEPPPVESAWIGGCVKEDYRTTPHAPSDQICPSCLVSSGGDEAMSWSCVGGADEVLERASVVGLASSSCCSRVGENTPATEGYWHIQTAFASLGAAYCCR